MSEQDLERLAVLVAQRVADQLRERDEPLVDDNGAAAILGVPATWVASEARKGSIPHLRLGHYRRYKPADLRAWLEGQAA